MPAYLTGEPLLPKGVYRDRRAFGQAVRRAMRAKTLAGYARDHWMGRSATLTDGTVLTYEPAWQSFLKTERAS
jgi:hypothetical protein